MFNLDTMFPEAFTEEYEEYQKFLREAAEEE